jgi:hypothetical protein
MIRAFWVSTQFLHRSTDEQLSTVINDLRRHHIALAFEAEIMADDPAHPCGAGVPTYGARSHSDCRRSRGPPGRQD